MTSTDPLMRSVLADQVKEWLLEAILSGSYPPDSRIVETAVAKELGTSQAPVREALRGLEALGIVEIAPFRGARVRRLDAAAHLGIRPGEAPLAQHAHRGPVTVLAHDPGIEPGQVVLGESWGRDHGCSGSRGVASRHGHRGSSSVEGGSGSP